MMRVFLVVAACAVWRTDAFQPNSFPAFRRCSPLLQDASTTPEGEDETSTQKVDTFLSQKFPSFHSLLMKNEDIWKVLEDDTTDGSGYTLFSPSEQAFDDLGDKKLKQLQDDRNLETAQKMAAYHVVSLQKLTATQLRTEDWTGPKPQDGSPRPFTVGGILTLGGEVPVGRSKSGGFLGWGAKEDGDAVIGPNARIVKSYLIGDDAIVHEMDALISPELLWRYCDQLRIPGF